MASKIIMGSKVRFQGEKYINMVQFQKVKTYTMIGGSWVSNPWSVKFYLLLISIYNNIYF